MMPVSAFSKSATLSLNTAKGVFVHREGRWDLMLNVDRLAINDQHIVKYDKTDATHRQLLGMRGYVHSSLDRGYHALAVSTFARLIRRLAL